KGNPYDNAFMESFYKTLKYEEVHLWNYETYGEVIERLPFFLEEVYNRKRLHSSIGYVPPTEFEAAISNMKPADRPVLNLCRKLSSSRGALHYYPLDSAVIVKTKAEWTKFFVRATA